MTSGFNICADKTKDGLLNEMLGFTEEELIKMKEAKEQIAEHSKYEDIQSIPNIHKYTIVAVNDELYVEEL